MKGTYLQMLLSHLRASKEATRTSLFKAEVAHIYGVAARYQYDCTISDLGGDEGQEIAMFVEDVALKVLNAETLDVPKYVNDFYTQVCRFVTHLEL